MARAYLIVRKEGGEAIFSDNLKDAKGQVALTPSDAPYEFVLARDDKEEVVLKVRDLLETEVPAVLESTNLGIKLVADVEKPQPEPDKGSS